MFLPEVELLEDSPVRSWYAGHEAAHVGRPTLLYAQEKDERETAKDLGSLFCQRRQAENKDVKASPVKSVEIVILGIYLFCMSMMYA